MTAAIVNHRRAPLVARTEGASTSDTTIPASVKIAGAESATPATPPTSNQRHRVVDSGIATVSSAHAMSAAATRASVSYGFAMMLKRTKTGEQAARAAHHSAAGTSSSRIATRHTTKGNARPAASG